MVQPWRFRMDYSQARLPGNEDLGLTGLSLLADTPSGFFLGPSLQAALRGQRGGFFVGGLEGGLRIPLNRALTLEGGLFLGGGGGGGAPVGGGLMVRPRLGLIWARGRSRLGLGLAHLRFPNGEIASTQAYVSWESSLSSLRLVDSTETLDLPWPSSLPLHLERGFLELRGTRFLNQEGASATDLLGLTWGRALGRNFFFQVEAASAARGERAGYMEALVGLGARVALGRFSLRGALSAGSGGGGGVRTGGGFLVKASGGLQFQVTPALHLSAEAGRLAAPSTSLRVTTLSLGVGLTFDSAAPGNPSTPGTLPPEPSALKWRLSSGFQRYDSVARKAGSPEPLEQFVFKAECLLSDHVYATGQSGWATGGHAGAWATGLLGLGAQTASFQGHRLRVELAAGAGGGGGVDSCGGALVQALAGWNWDFSPSWSVHLMAGRVRAPQGGFSASLVDLGLGFRGIRLGVFPSGR